MSEEPAAALPWQLADELVQAQVEAQLLGAAAHPVCLGRYQIERALGAGGMGQLLLAFDSDLERRVALKLIGPGLADSPQARARVVGEARAMAKLSDPHVAQVYEVDEIDGRLFLAIEYVDGQDLGAWLGDERRPWLDVLNVLRQAGSGLAAAHDKGITHGDFKPANVMLDHDARAKVVDFGLAQKGEAGGEPRTVSSGWGGTPAYMAPEQWDGEGVGPLTDQFSYCVALYEGLAGRLPFSGTTEAELRRSLRHAPQAGVSAAPRWVMRAVLRGLHLDPQQRWPDMRGLLRALDPARRRRRWIVAGMVTVTSVLTALALRTPTDRCASAGQPMAQAWTDARREGVVQAAIETEAVWGEITGQRLVEQLDAHAEAWRVAARGMCGAERVAEHSVGAACLDASRERLTAIVDEVGTRDPALLVSAVARAELLPGPSACAQLPATTGRPLDAAAVAAADEGIAAVEHSLGTMLVRAGAGSYVEAVERGERAALEAVALAETAASDPLLARACWMAGRIYLGQGDPQRAERYFRRGLVSARAATDAALAAAITIELVYAVARDRERIPEAEDLAEQAAGMIAALGTPPLLDARLKSHRASALAHAREAKQAEAVALHTDAVQTLADALGAQHPHAIVARGNLGTALNYARRASEAQVQLAEAVDAATQAWGGDHPRTALLMGTLGLSRLRQGDVGEAEHHLRRSLEIRAKALGATHTQVDDARYNLATALRHGKRHAEALPLLEAGLANKITRLGPDDAQLGPWWVATGESALAVGDRVRAREALGASLRIFERTGASARDYARVRLGLARAWAREDMARARVFAEQARTDAVGGKRREEIEAFLASL